MSTEGRSMATALRMRVSMSAIGSVIIESPACLLHSGNQSIQSHVAETQPAQLELAINGARSSAQLAAPLAPTTEFRFPVRLFNFCLAGHENVAPLCLFCADGQTEFFEQHPRLGIGIGAGHQGNMHALRMRHFVGVDLGKY